MRTPRTLNIFLLSTLTVCPLADAEDGLYFGLQAGVVRNDDAGFDDVTHAGLALGYEFLDAGVADVAIEGVYTTSIDEADAPAGEWDLDTIGLFGALRTAGPVYAVARGGVLHRQLEAGAMSTDDTGFAAGLGLGVSLAVAQLELQYTRFDSALHFVGLTVNVKTPF